MPLTWYGTPDIHFRTIRDFVKPASEMGVTVEKALAINDRTQCGRVSGQ